MSKKTAIETSLENGNVNEIQEFIKAGGNIYKEFEKESSLYVRETLLSRACRLKKTQIIEVLLNVYERDYNVAEQFVSNEKDKNVLLKYIFIALSEEEVKKVLNLAKKSQNYSKHFLVFLADRKEFVLAAVIDDKDLMHQLYKNGITYHKFSNKRWSKPRSCGWNDESIGFT